MKRLIYYLMALLGFGVQGCEYLDKPDGGEVCMYGTPTVEFHLSARVVDQAGNPIQGIEATTKGGMPFDDKTGFSNYQGIIEAYTHYGFPGDQYEVIFNDIDGEANGGEYAKLILDITEKVTQVEQGDGSWYSGGYKAELGDVTLKLKGEDDQNDPIVETNYNINLKAVVVNEAGEPIQGIHAYPEGDEFKGREGYSDYLGNISTYDNIRSVGGKFIIHFEDIDGEYNLGEFESLSIDITDKVSEVSTTGYANVDLGQVVMKLKKTL